jgi:hypothetical protein
MQRAGVSLPAIQERFVPRGHFADSTAEFSYLPSALGVATIPQPRTHHHAA